MAFQRAAAGFEAASNAVLKLDPTCDSDPASRAVCCRAARKATRIVYRYRLNAARRARLAN
jgi:hypothetical protein